MDVDGVMTNGQIIYDSINRETKVFNVKDGYGIILLQRAGFRTAIISARAAQPVLYRARDLKIGRVYQGADPKITAYRCMLKDFRVRDEEVCFIGDDLPDIPLIRQVGLGVAVRDAAPDVRKAADYITRCRGGEGAVREIAELILKAKGVWTKILKNC